MKSNNPSFFEDAVRAAFGDGLPGFGRKGEDEGLLELRDVNAFLLQVWILPHHAGGVELGCAGSVGVAASNHRTLICYRTNSSHSCDILTEWSSYFK